jgi:hypothetical protein
MKKDYDGGVLNTFDDWIEISGISNLQGAASRACNLRIESHPSVVDGVSYSVNFRMGIMEEDGTLAFVPPNEMGIGLTLGESKLFCETLYNLAKQNSERNGSVEIAFSGDNGAKPFGGRESYFKRTKLGKRRSNLTITIQPTASTEGVAKISLTDQTKETAFFCSAILSAQHALIFSYMLRCSFTECLEMYRRDIG